MKVIFFTGKGGVGKSTSSALFASKLAAMGKRVFLNSIDPAHNLHDIFECRLGAMAKEIAPGLTIMETDLDFWVKKYLKDTEREFKDIYRYQEAFNLHKYFNTLKYSPGLEEYAVLLALQDSIEKYSDRDYIVFDTPPTALTLKFLALPSVSLLWLEELLKFREMILEKKGIISKILKKGENGASETDPVLKRINGLIETYRSLADLFRDGEKTKVFLVLNPDRLSLSESRDIHKRLKSLGIGLPFVVYNKCDPPARVPESLKEEFSESNIFAMEKRELEMIGLKTFHSINLDREIGILLNH